MYAQPRTLSQAQGPVRMQLMLGNGAEPLQGPHNAINNEILSLLQENALRQTDVDTWRSCVRELRQTLKQLGSDWFVRAFGSAANGFGTRASDFDVVCYREGVSEQDRPLATQELRSQLLPLLIKHPDFEIVEEIWGARVPILKLKFANKLDVDLSCHNIETLPNSQLLRAYASLAPVVRDLGIAVKLWAKGEGVRGAATGHLSSYTLTLMAIYYMQVDPIVRLPTLPVQEFTGTVDMPAAARVQWVCKVPLAILLSRFFQFFATDFQWGVEVASVRLGRRTPALDPEFASLRGRHLPRLHVEDPFLTGRNLNCVLGTAQEEVLFAAILSTAHALKHGVVPASLRRRNTENDASWAAMPLTLPPPSLTRPPGTPRGQSNSGSPQIPEAGDHGSADQALHGLLHTGTAVGSSSQQELQSANGRGNSADGEHTQQARLTSSAALSETPHLDAGIEQQAGTKNESTGKADLIMNGRPAGAEPPEPGMVPSTRLFPTWRL